MIPEGSAAAGGGLERRRGFRQVSLPLGLGLLRFSAFAFLCCSCVAAGGVSAVASGPGSSIGGSVVSFRGVVEAYGSEPHLVFMIRAADGRLFYPEGSLQKAVSPLRDAEYEWTGVLLPPRPALSGIVPAHDGSFSSLTWRP